MRLLNPLVGLVLEIVIIALVLTVDALLTRSGRRREDLIPTLPQLLCGRRRGGHAPVTRIAAGVVQLRCFACNRALSSGWDFRRRAPVAIARRRRWVRKAA